MHYSRNHCSSVNCLELRCHVKRSRSCELTCCRALKTTRTPALKTVASPSTQSKLPPHVAAAGENISEVDVVVIGAGLGGLCCAALLARCVCRKQNVPFPVSENLVHIHYNALLSIMSRLRSQSSLVAPLMPRDVDFTSTNLVVKVHLPRQLRTGLLRWMSRKLYAVGSVSTQSEGELSCHWSVMSVLRYRHLGYLSTDLTLP